jgi:hypothetical protein
MGLRIAVDEQVHATLEWLLVTQIIKNKSTKLKYKLLCIHVSNCELKFEVHLLHVPEPEMYNEWG